MSPNSVYYGSRSKLTIWQFFFKHSIIIYFRSWNSFVGLCFGVSIFGLLKVLYQFSIFHWVFSYFIKLDGIHCYRNRHWDYRIFHQNSFLRLYWSREIDSTIFHQSKGIIENTKGRYFTISWVIEKSRGVNLNIFFNTSMPLENEIKTVQQYWNCRW